MANITTPTGPPLRMVGQKTFFDGERGTPAVFVALIIVSATSPSLIRNMLAVLYPNSTYLNNTRPWKTLLVDFSMTVLPVELMITLLNRYSLYFYLLTLFLIGCLFTWTLIGKRFVELIPSTPFRSSPMTNCPFVSYFRAYTNIFTGFSILAVDFIIYPRYFYKSRVYGTALMDSGLGFYIISNAIVSSEARGIVSRLSTRSTLLKAIKDTIPLIFLGFARYQVTRMANYHVPMQEYGVHWNFFFTLAVVKLSSTFLGCYTPRRLQPLLGPVIITIHQYILNKGLKWFVLFGYNGDAARNGLLESNREGIVSSIGFVAIYFIGIQLGTILMVKRETIGEWLKTLAHLVTVCSLSWLLMYVTAALVDRPSRKFANMSYMFFVIGVTSLLMVEGLAFDIIITYFKRLAVTRMAASDARVLETSDRTCTLLQAINYNGLLFFTLANLMTGAVNLSINAKSYSRPAAFVIVNIYMLILSVIFLNLYNKKFAFKAYLWRDKKNSSVSANQLPR